MSYSPVTHVIFDLDGTILDTEPIYQKVLDDIAKEFGKEVTKDIRMKIMGSTETDTLKIFISELKISTTLEEMLPKYKGMCEKRLPNVPLMPGVEKLVRHLHKNKIPIAIATSSSDHMVEVKTMHLKDFFNLFHHKVMGSTDPEVKRGKPNPDIFIICASRFDDKPNPSKCLVFEDAPNGATAGISANMQVVLIPDKNTDRNLCKIATQLLESMLQFKPELFGLPPYKKCAC